MNIGIFDSGIGGMTLLQQALSSLPNENYIFYADTDHVPYGTKTREQVIGYVDEIISFMLAHECKAVVIACNTATSVAAEAMREKYDIPIIGIEPAVKPAVENSRGKRVMVVATPLTVSEKKLKALVERVDDSHLVDMLALPQLVSFAERGEFDSEAVYQYIKSAFEGYDISKYGELVLGCTHFNYFKDTFQKIFPSGIQMIDGSQGTINQLRRVLQQNGYMENSPSAGKLNLQNNVRYFVSGRELTSCEDLAKMSSLLERLEKMKKL